MTKFDSTSKTHSRALNGWNTNVELGNSEGFGTRNVWQTSSYGTVMSSPSSNQSDGHCEHMAVWLTPFFTLRKVSFHKLASSFRIRYSRGHPWVTSRIISGSIPETVPFFRIVKGLQWKPVAKNESPFENLGSHLRFSKIFSLKWLTFCSKRSKTIVWLDRIDITEIFVLLLPLAIKMSKPTKDTCL